MKITHIKMLSVRVCIHTNCHSAVHFNEYNIILYIHGRRKVYKLTDTSNRGPHRLFSRIG